MSFLRIAGRNLFVITAGFRLKDCRNDGICKFLAFDFLYRTQVKSGNLVNFSLKKATKAGISCLLIKKHLKEYSRNSTWLLSQ